MARSLDDVGHLRALPQDLPCPPALVLALGLDVHPGEYTYSVVNRYLTGSAPIIRPEVGMPCTVGIGVPGTVVAVSISRHRIVVQCDRVEHGQIIRDKQGEKHTYIRGKRGTYRGLHLNVLPHVG